MVTQVSLGMRPYGDRVFLETQVRKISIGGVHLPPGKIDQENLGVVLDVGPRVKSGELRPGIQVIFNPYAGTSFRKVSGNEILVVKEEDIELVVGDDLSVS